VVAALLVLQVVLLWFSLGVYSEISVLCTAPASKGLGLLFGLIHMLFLALLVLGLISFRFTAVRLPYIALLAAALVALPIQATLVNTGQLWCDTP
jgi:hypothetical protein